MAQLPDDLEQALVHLGLLQAGQPVSGEPLTGGVASDIWRVDIAGDSVCVKRALEQFKVEREWRVSPDRNAYEVAWFKVVGNIARQAIPRILAHDPLAGVFVMEYFSPLEYQLWKSQLRDGLVEQKTIAALAEILLKIHRSTASDAEIAMRFDTDALFYSLRLEPYLHATAESHPDLAAQLVGIADMIGKNKKALVHGDVSPKNILVGERGPVILDAECAWYGDPAFDLAFCLNHLLLKGVWNPAARVALADGARLMLQTYMAGVNWEQPHRLGERVAAILPGLMLARIDGKSPVEYIVDESDKARVREFARRFLLRPSISPLEVIDAWAESGNTGTTVSW